ncbi:MAG: hypothetical protein C4523_17480 [Myxococcales bacterium]|nr:MAG: hypothetical protein C4523_17480 [Myxococcales bacterium]
MRQGDACHIDFAALRRERSAPGEQVVLAPGNVLIPATHVAVLTVVASSVAVTAYDAKLKRGGICHFVRAIPDPGRPLTPLYGLPAVAALIGHFLDQGATPETLRVGVYGGAYPEWAAAREREIARENVSVVIDVLKRKDIVPWDQDCAGNRGRKLIYMTGTNEIAVLKTDLVRKNDWFPEVPTNGGPT